MSADPPVVNLNPGPVPLAARTREAMDGPLVSHRSPEFEAIHRDCRSMLGRVFDTDDELIVVNGNGNLALETAIVNAVHPGDTAVCLTNGKFGDNLVEMLSRHAADVRVVEADWGAPFELDAVESVLDGSVAAVCMTHCETSTGMLNPVEPVAELAAEHDALSVVDGVSSVGGARLPVDDWSIDLAVTASQKCLSAPPGLGAVTLSDRALDRWRSNPRTMPYNLDVGRYLDAAARDQTPSTAPVHTYRALQRSLGDILDSGLEAHVRSQARRAAAIRQAAPAMGLEVFPTTDAHTAPSPTVTSLALPADLASARVLSGLRDRGVLASAGIGPVADRTVRLATMSNAITDGDVGRAVRALGAVMADLDWPVDRAAVEGALADLDGPADP